MGERLEQAIAEAAEIEAVEASAVSGAPAPLPSHVKVSRPNRARSRVLQVRLNPDEMEALEQIAEQRGLPVSTVAREHLLRLVAPRETAGKPQIDAALALVDELFVTASALRDLHAHGAFYDAELDVAHRGGPA